MARRSSQTFWSRITSVEHVAAIDKKENLAKIGKAVGLASGPGKLKV